MSSGVMLSFRPMNLKLHRSRERRRRERKPSPPCPHVWESHEEIDRLIENLKTAFVANRITSYKTSTTRKTVETTEERKLRVSSLPPQSRDDEVQFGLQGGGGLRSGEVLKNSGRFRTTENVKYQGWTDTTEICKSQVDNIFYQSQVVHIEHKQEKHLPEKTASLTPPLSSPAEDYSGSSQSTVVPRRQHVSVRERAKMLQQKVEEDYVSLILSQEESANEAAEGGEPRAEQAPRRAMEIPGAVRVLPPMPGGTPSGSRRGSVPRRGSSVDSAAVSPLTLLRASPFSRRAESQPPPMYVPPGQSPPGQHVRGRGEFCTSSYSARAMDVGRFGRQVYESDVSAASASPSAVQSCTTSACSTLDKAFLSSRPKEGAHDRDRRLTPVGNYDSEVEELTASHCKRKSLRSVNAAPNQTMTQLGPAKRSRDGYEADTDDTLARRRGSSVKEMARWIQVCLILSPLPPSLSIYLALTQDPVPIQVTQPSIIRTSLDLSCHPLSILFGSLDKASYQSINS